MHSGEWILLGLMDWDGKNISSWFNLVLKAIAKIWKCIKEDVLNVPQLLSFKFLNLLMSW